METYQSKYTPEQIQKIMEDTKRITDRNQELIDKISSTIETSKQARSAYDDFEAKYKKFQDDFSKALSNMVGGIDLGQLQQNPSEEKYKDIITIDQSEMKQKLQELLNNKKHISFLTGAGISKASGVPTFRGQGGYYENMDDVIKLLSYSNYQQNEKEVWDFINKLMQTVLKNKPNKGHESINQIMAIKNIETSVITQNIDGYHSYTINDKKDFIKTQNVFEIHGNAKYMRCDNNDCTLYEQMLLIDKKIIENLQLPKCQKCNKVCRPHVLLFDECYQEKFYRQKEILQKLFKDQDEKIIEELKHMKQSINESDVLFVIGTELTTGLANRIVREFNQRDKLIIEINIDNVIKKGTNAYFIKGKSEEILQLVYQVLQQIHTIKK